MSIDNLQTVDIQIDSEQAGIQKLNSNVPLVSEHDHTAGKGTAITPSAMSINEDLSINNQKLTSIGGAVLTSTVGTKVNLEAYTDGTDIFFQDGNGNDIQITTGGAVNVTGSGNISGLTGMAGLAFSGSTFQFTDAIGGRANLLFKNAQLVNNGNTVTITHNATGTRTITLPDETTTLVGIDSNQTLTNKSLDSTNTLTGCTLNSVVINTSTFDAATLTGITLTDSTLSNCLRTGRTSHTVAAVDDTVVLASTSGQTIFITTAGRNFNLNVSALPDNWIGEIIIRNSAFSFITVTLTDSFKISAKTSLSIVPFSYNKIQAAKFDSSTLGFVAELIEAPVRQFAERQSSTNGSPGDAGIQTDFSWLCPDDTTEILLSLYGGGASGSTISSSGASINGGGSGGAFRQLIKVIPGQRYNIKLGSGGTAVSMIGTGNVSGADSEFIGSSTAKINGDNLTIVAKAGTGTTNGTVAFRRGTLDFLDTNYTVASQGALGPMGGSTLRSNGGTNTGTGSSGGGAGYAGGSNTSSGVAGGFGGNGGIEIEYYSIVGNSIG